MFFDFLRKKCVYKIRTMSTVNPELSNPLGVSLEVCHFDGKSSLFQGATLLNQPGFTNPGCTWYQHEGELLHTTRNHRIAESLSRRWVHVHFPSATDLVPTIISQIPSGNQAWQWRIPYKWRFSSLGKSWITGWFSSHVWLHHRVYWV